MLTDRLMKVRRKTVIWISVGAVAVGCFAVGILFFSSHDPFFRARDFVSERWLAGDQRARGEMARSLVRSGFLSDKTKTEVLALLGRPDSISAAEMSYLVDIGMRWGGTPWTYRLIIHFHEAGQKVRDFALMD
jgi:hypothetical protein